MRQKLFTSPVLGLVIYPPGWEPTPVEFHSAGICGGVKGGCKFCAPPNFMSVPYGDGRGEFRSRTGKTYRFDSGHAPEVWERVRKVRRGE